ncbi:hypothetical protein [Streptomyces stelliscabiei]|uniref:hypothetical protein n=1 Tax=Streptomyces stelliscabiei TaxID=146820 RepID=UPI003A8C9C47
MGRRHGDASRILAYDSPFSLYRTDGLKLHKADVLTTIPSSRVCPCSTTGPNTYYDAATPLAGVKITDTNTKIEIVKEAEDGSTMSVKVGPAVK